MANWEAHGYVCCPSVDCAIRINKGHRKEPMPPDCTTCGTPIPPNGTNAEYQSFSVVTYEFPEGVDGDNGSCP